MRKAISLLLLFVFYSLSYHVQAGIVTRPLAQTIASNFFKVTYPDAGFHGEVTPVLKYTQYEPDSSVDFYVFDINPGPGFVVVSAHNEVIPILGYSNESHFSLNFQQIGLSDWIKQTTLQIHRQ